MKKIIILVVGCILTLNTAFALNNEDTKSTSYTCDSPQVCQFSLNHYTGTIDDNRATAQITVKLSCPQEDDVYATVVVVIDDELIASDVIKIPANKTESSPVRITVPKEYKGQKYKLGVQ